MARTSPAGVQDLYLMQEQREDEGTDAEPKGKKRKVQGGAEPRKRSRTLDFAAKDNAQASACGVSSGAPLPGTFPPAKRMRGSTSPLPASLPLFQPPPPNSMPLQGTSSELSPLVHSCGLCPEHDSWGRQTVA